MILRVSVQGDGVEVVVPRRASERDVNRFIERNQGWIEQRLNARPKRITFTPGAVIPFQGVPHSLELTGALRGGVQVEDGTIRIACLAEHMPRRMRTWLTAQARAALSASIAPRVEAMRVSPPAVTIRDTTSRWGSCSAKGALSFSWRLILAPPEILDYVAAHEIAHLRHMNHGPRFWQLCEQLAPQTAEARRWLKANGATLHRYG